jgi:hypothetical protein
MPDMSRGRRQMKRDTLVLQVWGLGVRLTTSHRWREKNAGRLFRRPKLTLSCSAEGQEGSLKKGGHSYRPLDQNDNFLTNESKDFN